MNIWLYGLPSSGKTTLSNELCIRLPELKQLDGDIVRKTFDDNLGYSKADRFVQLKRVVDLCNNLNDVGVDCIVSVITPYREFRSYIREHLESVKLVYVDCSPETCERRDPKGMYKKARNGELKEFTGVSGTFEYPSVGEYDFFINTENNTVNQCVDSIIKKL
jgi:adenylylsulfate kinase